MNRKFVSLAIAAAMISASAVTVTAKNALPVGNLERNETIRLELELESSQTELPEHKIELFDNDEDEYIPDEDFYKYGSDYAYEDFEKRDKTEEKQQLYDDMLAKCIKIAASDGDWLAESELTADMTEGELINKLNDLLNNHSEYFISSELNTTLTADDVSDVYFIFRNDHPEFYWLSNVAFPVITSRGSDITIFLPLMLCDKYSSGTTRKAMDETIEDSVDEFLKTVGKSGADSTYDKVKLVHDLIIDEVDYGYMTDDNGIYYVDDNGEKIPLDTEYAHSIVGVFDDNKKTDVVCEGYAKAFQLLLNALNIDNIFVTGLGGSDESWGGHAWSMVRMDDGEYYNFDVTWDDPNDDRDPQYDYFAVGEEFDKTHIINTPSGMWERVPEGIDMNLYQPSFLYELPEVPEDDYSPSTPVRTAPPIGTADSAETDDPGVPDDPAVTDDPGVPDDPTETDGPGTADDPTETDGPGTVDEPDITEEPFEVVMEECEIVVDNATGETEIEISFDEVPESAKAYVARYDSEGALIGLEMMDITEAQISMSVIIDGTDVLKVFAWSTDDSDMNKPVSRSGIIEVHNDNEPDAAESPAGTPGAADDEPPTEELPTAVPSVAARPTPRPAG